MEKKRRRTSFPGWSRVAAFLTCRRVLVLFGPLPASRSSVGGRRPEATLHYVLTLLAFLARIRRPLGTRVPLLRCRQPTPALSRLRRKGENGARGGRNGALRDQRRSLVCRRPVRSRHGLPRGQPACTYTRRPCVLGEGAPSEGSVCRASRNGTGYDCGSPRQGMDW